MVIKPTSKRYKVMIEDNLFYVVVIIFVGNRSDKERE
jgi:hypothetical protein